jgi:protein-L-isoaspartate(D-aspartate) O-methyltransferase
VDLRVAQPLVEQVKEGRRMIIPVGRPWHQDLVLLRKRAGKLEQRDVLPVSFVPMTGEAAGKSEGRSPKVEGSVQPEPKGRR